jgi:hypothetical protein
MCIHADGCCAVGGQHVRLDGHAKMPEDVLWAPIPLLTLPQEVLLADPRLAPVHLAGGLTPVPHTDGAGHTQAPGCLQLIVLLKMTYMGAHGWGSWTLPQHGQPCAGAPTVAVA